VRAENIAVVSPYRPGVFQKEVGYSLERSASFFDDILLRNESRIAIILMKII
jgi:hypothetical protein